MFVSDEVLLDVSFAAAQARLANLARGGSLLSASQSAYDDGITGLARVGPLGSGPGISRLVQVHFRDLVTREGSALLTLRWETVGPGGGLFPALDADITLTPAGEQATLLKLAGTYRPPLGAVGAGLDRAILHRVATATTRTFMSRVAGAIAHPASAAEREQGIARAAPSGLPPATETP
jgi:hypothetical protein